MREDEKRFLIDVYKNKDKIITFNLIKRPYAPRDLINEPDFYINYKRAWYLLDKWSGKDWYDYGVTLDLGWLTEKGKTKVMELINE